MHSELDMVLNGGNMTGDPHLAVAGRTFHLSLLRPFAYFHALYHAT